jgi:hypothetical protein
MMAKNLPPGQLAWKMPLRLLLDAISALKSLFAGQAIYFMAIGKAYFAFVKWVLFKRGESIFPQKKSGKLHGLSSRSVVWQYFVLGRKTFTEIMRGKS